ncbi:hypothetical protein D3C84_922770 [compost metagenome]
MQQIEIRAGQVHPRHVGKVHQPPQLHVQLLLIQVPETALQTGQVTGTNQLHARVNVAHLPTVFEVQLHGARQHGETQTEQQNEQQQTPQQPTGAGANHLEFAGRLIMSR